MAFFLHDAQHPRSLKGKQRKTPTNAFSLPFFVSGQKEKKSTHSNTVAETLYGNMGMIPDLFCFFS